MKMLISQATFGEYVIFEECDLSKSIPPNGFTFEELLTTIYPSRQVQGITAKGTPPNVVE